MREVPIAQQLHVPVAGEFAAMYGEVLESHTGSIYLCADKFLESGVTIHSWGCSFTRTADQHCEDVVGLPTRRLARVARGRENFSVLGVLWGFWASRPFISSNTFGLSFEFAAHADRRCGPPLEGRVVVSTTAQRAIATDLGDHQEIRNPKTLGINEWSY